MNTNPHKELNKSKEKPDPPLTVKELMAAVSDVNDWHALGIQLDLKMSQLMDIDVTYHKEGVERKKAEMFSAWLNNSPSTSWNNLIKALKAIGKDKVASQIATQLPTATDTQLPTATATQLPTATDTQLPTATDTQLPTATDTQLPTDSAVAIEDNISRTLSEFYLEMHSIAHMVSSYKAGSRTVCSKTLRAK